MKNKLSLALSAALAMTLVLLAGCQVEPRGSTERVGQIDFITSEMDPVINLGILGNRIDLDANNDTSIRASADNTVDIEINAEDVIQFLNASVVLHDADASDFDLVWDGNAQDFYVCLDDSADDLVIGLGSTCGTTPAISIDENQVVTLSADPIFGGTTPVLTIGDAGAEDTALVFDGNAQDFYVGLDDSADDLVVGLGSAVGTTPALSIDENLDITLHDASASDADVTFDGNAQDFYLCLDDSADDLVIGLGGTCGTTPALAVDENQVVTINVAYIVPTETTTAANVLTASECGKVVMLGAAAGAGYQTDLPVPTAGCSFRLIISEAFATTDHTIVTNGSANIIIGGINELEVDTSDDGPSSVVGDLITFSASLESLGDYIEVVSDGTSWFLSGQTVLDGAIVIGST